MPQASEKVLPCFNAFHRDGRFAGVFPGTAEEAVVAAFAQNVRKDYNVRGYRQYDFLIKHEGNRVLCGPYRVDRWMVVQ